MKKNKIEKINIGIGIISIFAGLFLNEWVLSILVSSDGVLESSTKVKILLFNIIACSIGIIFLYYRKRINVPIPSVQNLVLMLLSLVVGFVIVEFAARYYLTNFAHKNVLARYGTYNMIQNQNVRFTRHPYLNYYPTPNYKDDHGNRHNSLGHRGEEIILPKPDGIFRIVCIGGSTTYTEKVLNYKESYPYLLEKELHLMGKKNVEVINAGVGNYDSWASLVNLEFRVLDLEPDMVIVYHGDNDVESRLVIPYYYRGDNTGRVSPIEKPDIDLFDRFVVSRIIMGMLGRGKSYGDISSTISSSTYLYDEYISQLKDGRYPSGYFKKIEAMQILAENQPIYTKRNINNMVSISKGNNINIILTSFAYSPLTTETSSQLYKQAISENNEVMHEVAQNREVLFFDFAAVMPQDEKYWYRDGVHNSPSGAALKAKLFANFIIENVIGHK